MPQALLPVDESVSLPPSIKRAAEAANALHARVYEAQQPDPAATQQPDPAATQQPDPAATQQPHTPQADPADSRPTPQADPADSQVTPEQWQHRYLSMKGRFDQSQVTIGSLQQQMSELGDELVRTQQHIQRQPTPQPQQRQPAPQPRRLVTDADMTTYGPELIDMVRRAAVEAVSPDLTAVAQQNQHTAQQVKNDATQRLYTALDHGVPDWREINVNPRFKMWCRSQDVYSGQLRGKLLNAAFQAANAPRVIAFFKGFQEEEVATGNAPVPQQQPGTAPPREPALDIGMLTAPGRAKPATGEVPGAADKPIFTRAQISQFYSQEGRARYVGREADRKSDEGLIFAAQKDGRVR